MTYNLTINFSDEEIPQGAGGGLLYVAHAPIPGSLQLFCNGLLLSSIAGDYLVTGQVISLRIPIAPDDKLVCFYRYL